jgi:hypothetical protein
MVFSHGSTGSNAEKELYNVLILVTREERTEFQEEKNIGTPLIG